ncbi:NAD(P)H-hydrate dehydratase [Aggregicoccus sp. 17bor-14]|uniref:NAD(P)H-hydrate dehydratase n=1 Tax=Myxococcaceae TaxID=31 RepID=UPI00129CECC3|nr:MULTISPECIES: NAD(P)H-hydrate dehydratase [Myxococcaceae]MBF5044175.1 NAD(P)H-hydrate dehydratase [Simulacricoccus sp. 17bor-14]MRI89925.1 NAD(P)H-hydrate dehydratase [Aggregicoccus sp. 17bor-14]
MKPVLTAAQMREAEGRAAALGVSSALLMESAGRALAEAVRGLLRPGGRVALLCGPGNNGGDGWVAARLLLAGGVRAELALVGERARLSAEAARNLEVLEGAGGEALALEALAPLREGDVAVDALLGTGLSRAPEGPFAEAIRWLERQREAGAKVVSADLPSGLHSDSGQAFEPCVQADLTVAFGAAKLGQVLQPGAARSGELSVADIGLPAGVLERLAGESAHLVEAADVLAAFPAREADTHKGTFGHVLVVAGSRGKSGAAALSGQGALRGGAGLVTVATPADALDAVLAHAPELMGVPLPAGAALGPEHLDALLAAAEGKDALVLGPGLPRGPGTAALLGELLSRVEAPALLDADALNAVSEDLSVLARAKGPLVLTPHPGEMARLCGQPTKQVQAARVQVARDFARAHGVTLVLKGSRTLTALADGRVYVNPTGNAGMATGGAGDVLSGLTGALLAQGLEPAVAAWAAVYAHGAAGDLAARRRGQAGLLARDLLEGLCELWVGWQR